MEGSPSEDSGDSNSPSKKGEEDDEAQPPEASLPTQEEADLKKAGSIRSSLLKSITTVVSGDRIRSTVKKSVGGFQKMRKPGDEVSKSKKKSRQAEEESPEPARPRPPRLNEHVSYEENLLSRTLEDAGHWAYGIVATELWVYDDANGYLLRPEGAFWCDRTLHPRHGSKKEYEDCPMCALVYREHPNFVRPLPVFPGVGMPGVLWAEAGKAEDADTTRRQMSTLAEHDESEDIYWRDVQALAADPDQPYNERLQNVSTADLGWAGAVPFNVEGQRGIVIYWSRTSVNMDQLQGVSNVRYLLAAAQYVSIAWALRLPRFATIREREERLRVLWRRLRLRMIAVIRIGATLDDISNGRIYEPKPEKRQGSKFSSLNDPKEVARIMMEEGKHLAEKTVEAANTQRKLVTRKLKALARKCRGANIRAPPVFTWGASIWSFVGTLISLLILLNVNEHIKGTYGDKYALTLGPLSSFTASVFVLTAAPASQPRNNIIAYNFAMIIGLCLAYITSVPVWVRQAIAVSVTVFSMVKFGFLHAPAAGVALTFASGSQNWTNILSMTLCSLLVITLGTVINNLSDKRQYPTSWGFRPLIKAYNRHFKRKES
jgi:hypothetical protein